MAPVPAPPPTTCPTGTHCWMGDLLHDDAWVVGCMLALAELVFCGNAPVCVCVCVCVCFGGERVVSWGATEAVNTVIRGWDQVAALRDDPEYVSRFKSLFDKMDSVGHPLSAPCGCAHAHTHSHMHMYMCVCVSTCTYTSMYPYNRTRMFSPLTHRHKQRHPW